MPDVKKCSRCGAQNAATAEWCTLCLTRFEPASKLPVAPEAEITGEPAALAGAPASEPASAEPQAAGETTAAPEPAASRIRVPPSGEGISGGNGHDRVSLPEETRPPEPNGKREGFVSGPPPPVRDVPVKFLRDGNRVRWVCPACETPNDIEASACRICGTVMARLFAPEGPEKSAPLKPPAKAMALSAVLPGLGHVYTGATPAGLSRAGLYIWSVVIAVLFLVRPPVRARGLLRGVGVLFAVSAAIVWVISLVESGRYAEGDRTPIVPPRTMTWASAGLTLLLFLGLAAAAFTRG